MRRIRWTQCSRLSAVVLAALVVTGGATAAAAKSGTGSVSGRVLDATGVPVAGVCVLVDGAGPVTTDATGGYTADGLTVGTHHVQFSDCRPQPEFVAQWYLGRASADAADPVDVADGTDSQLADVTMQAGVAVAGTVRDPDGNPVAGISVNVNPVGNGVSTSAQTGADGSYTTAPIPPADYKVQFADPASPPAYAHEYWHDQASWNSADVLTLSAADGAVHGGVDQVLPAAATVRGTVTDAAGAPLSGICVNASVERGGNQDWIAGTTTDGSGTYSLGGLPPSTARVQFVDCSPAPTWSSGTRVRRTAATRRR